MSKMEDKEHPNEKVGTRYRLNESKLSTDFGWLAKGSIVYLFRNDNTACPWFTPDMNKVGSTCISWRKLNNVPNKNVIGGSLIEGVPREGGNLV